MSTMCWCRDCKYYHNEHCTNDKSDNCAEMIGEYNSCEHSEVVLEKVVQWWEKFSY